MRLATSPAKARATRTGSGRDVSYGDRRRDGNSGSGPSSARVRKVQTPAQRARRTAVRRRILSGQGTDRFGTWNVRTLRGLGKLEQLAGEMKRYRLSILAVTETHLPGEGEMVLDVETGYRLLFSGRLDGSNVEGVGIALSPHARAALRHYQAVSPRVLTAEFLSRAGPLSIVVAYAPTDQSSVEVKERFYSDLDHVMANANGLTMVMGDFNATLGKTMQGVVGPHGLGRQTSDNGKRLVAFASANGLCITNTIFPHKHIHQATWYPPDPRAKPSLKDYVLVKQRLRPSVLDTRVHRGGDLDSDHRLVVVSLRLKLKRKGTHGPRKRFEVELLKQAERRADYVESIGKCFEDRMGEGSVEERWKELQKAVVDSAEEHLHRRRPKQKKWISEGTLEMIEEKRLAFLRWQEDRQNVEKRKEYVDLCKKVRRAVRGDREKWLDETMQGMEEDMRRHRQGDFFKKMKQLTNSRVTPVDTILDETGQPLQKAEEKLARWKRHFESVLNVHSTVAEEALAGLVDHSQMDEPEVTREEVEKAVGKLRNGKSAGDDRIVAELLKNGGEAMIDWLWELLQTVWRTRQVPSEWKSATLVPLHKKKDRKVCDNYRGISLLNVPGKVLALILLERLQPIIEPQLMDTQCGFRKGRSTVDQIWVTRQVVEKAAEYQTPVYLCFVDLSKAYDSVDRTALVAILRSYGVPHQLVDIIQELYTGTGCHVRTADGVSEDFQVKTGVRQGCVLSPLLFNCVMDRILREATEMLGGGLNIEYTPAGGLFLSYRDKTTASSCIQNVLYADDLTLVAETRRELQHMLDVLDRACTRWGMQISVSKTKILTVEEQLVGDQPPITLRGQALEEVESFSYLGSEVGQSAKVEKEVAVRLEKAGKVYQMWRRKVFRSRNLGKATKMRVFRTMVMSVLLYSAETWPVTQHDIRRLKTFQMRCLRDILGLTLWDMHRNVDILKETGELPVEEQLRQRRLQWLGHVQRMPDHRPQKQLLRCRPQGKRRRPGGTSLRWIDVISRDLVGVTNWQEVVKDRAKWRAVVCQPKPVTV